MDISSTDTQLLTKVTVKDIDIKKYFPYFKNIFYKGKQYLPDNLKKIKIANLSVTDKRGGVAEILKGAVPLMRAMGLNTDWYVVKQDDDLFRLSRYFRDNFQGYQKKIPKRLLVKYKEFSKRLALEMDKLDYDIWIIHDYQPMLAATYFKSSGSRLIWYFHLDLQTEELSPEFITLLKKLLLPYDRYLLNSKEYVSSKLFKASRSSVIHPAIDPLAYKNKRITISEARYVVGAFNLDQNRPIITQVSRFNPWKGHVNALKIYKLAKRKIPGLQLVFISHLMNHNDPEQLRIYNKLKEQTKGDKDVFFITTSGKDNELIVKSFQKISNVILQMSTREGFGLTITEAMWKEKPVICGNCAGPRTQITQNVNGFIVTNAEDGAEKVYQIINDPKLAFRLGKNAKNHVRKNFLITRFVLDYIKEIKRALV